MTKKNDRPMYFRVRAYLWEVTYPARKQDLIAHAKRKGAPDEVIAALQQLPDNEFEGPTTVTRYLADNT